MVSLASPPPGLGGLGLQNLKLPAPPPALGQNAVAGIQKGAGAVLGVGGKIVGGAVSGIIFDALFPQSVADSSLDALPRDFFETGVGRDIQEESAGDPPWLGGQVPEARYVVSVEADVVNEDQELVIALSGNFGTNGGFGGLFKETNGSSTTLKFNGRDTEGNVEISTFYTVSGQYSFANERITNVRRVDNTSQEDDRQEGGDPPGVGARPGIRTSGGIINPPQSWTPPPATWTPYGGATTTYPPTGTPVGGVPGLGGGVISGGSSTTNQGGSVAGGGGISAGGSAGGSSGGSVGGGLGGSEGGSQTGGGLTGGLIGTGTTTQGQGNVVGGGTATGTGTGAGSPSQTVASSPTNTGANTGSIPVSIPVTTPTGKPITNVPSTPNEPTIPGTLPFPPSTGIKEGNPGQITKNPEANKPANTTPEPPPQKEDEKEKEPRVIPIPFDFNAEKCCKDTNKKIDDLVNDLECVIEAICDPEDPPALEFLKILVTKDPTPNKVMNPSSYGQGGDIVIAGYINWIVQGKSVGEQIAVRRREEIFLIPEWAEGWELYPCHDAEFSASVIEVSQSN